MTPQDADFAAELCAARAGLLIDPEKLYLLESRLGPVARRENFSALGDFLQAVRSRKEERLVWALVEALSPAAGDFFRDPAIFQSLAQEAHRRLGGGQAPLRIWVAGAGAGQEAYSLAMALQEIGAEAPLEFMASDLSERRLEKARLGLFSQFEVQRGLSAQRLVRHFDKADDLFKINDRVRRMIEWRKVNLAEPVDLGRFDLILCRNVLSGMTPEGRARAEQTLDEMLAPGGWLFLAPDESAHGLLSTPTRPGFHYKAGGLSAAA